MYDSRAMTNRRALRAANIAVIVVFLALTLLVNFAHSEKTPKPSPSCPACQFQHSSLATQVSLALFLPQIRFIEIVELAAVRGYLYLAAISLPARSPPQA